MGFLALVQRFEICNQQKFAPTCLTSNLLGLISVGNVESFSIVTAAWMYILEKSKRKQQQNLEALEIVNNTQGHIHSIARIEALEMLGEAGINFDHLDLEGANLEQLAIPHVHLHLVNLSKAILINSELSYTDMQDVNLSQANLTGAKLIGANLQGVNLQGANLTNADLTNANLTQADLTDVDLSVAHLENTLLPQQVSHQIS
ncbi:MAG: pentapeptide repeat-containing protein [Microcystaceae cyanobacterium]